MTSASDSATGAGRITALRASNYRSLGDDVEVTFGSLTALVGPNGSGKSNVLDALRFLRDALTVGLEPAISQRLGIGRLRRESASKPRPISIAVDLTVGSGGDYRYEIVIDSDTLNRYWIAHEELTLKLPAPQVGAGDDVRQHSSVELDVRLLSVQRGQVTSVPQGLAPVGSETDLVLPSIGSHGLVRPVVDALRSLRVHSFIPGHLSAPQVIGSRPPLDDVGVNWCAVLRDLPPAAHAELNLALAAVTGDIVDTRVETTGGYYVAEFAHRIDGVDRWFHAAQESDGTLRLAGIITALVQRPPPGFIGIEEPEVTINPGLLPLVYDYLVAASDSSQVVFTTHSPELLDLIDIENVRVVQRVNAATQVKEVSDSQRCMVREALTSPGELLRSGGLTVPDQETDLMSLLGDG